MSLFKVRTWWTSQCSDIEENYDVASLLCTRFGLADYEKDYIVVGSHSGLLSVLYPNPPVDSSYNISESQATDLLLERNLNAPILAVLSGRFTGSFRSEGTNQLAILHPNCLAVYNLSTVEGITEHGNHAQLHAVAEHTFTRAAFSMCKGHFGQVKGREFVCVGHLDGSLTFFEQDGISYDCTLPGPRPLPSPVVYVERTDSFLRVNSSWHLECFSYQDLCHSAVNKADVSSLWSVCLGEGLLDVIPVQVKETSTSIMILGERNLISLNDHGKIEFILKLDYSPKCFYSFIVGYYWEPDARLITAIASENSKLFIYEGANLIWAAQTEIVPVALQRSNLNDLPGGIVTLTQSGQVHVAFLGSEPHYFQVPPINLEEMNFEQSHRELHKLEEEIKQAIDLGDIDVINQMAENDLHLDFSVGPQLTECSFEVPSDLSGIPMCSGYLKFKAAAALDEIQIAIATPEGVRCSIEIQTYTDVAPNTVEELPIQFYLAENLHIETAKVEVLVSFINKQGIPRILTRTGHLPLEMLLRSDAPQKNASIKIMLYINSKSITPKLSTFFPEFCSDENDVQALGLSLLQFHANEVVTVVIAKNSNRIRVQSDILEALPLVLERIVNTIIAAERKGEDPITQKVRRAKKEGSGPSRMLLASPSIPAADILKRIDDHHSIQEDIRKQTALMDALWNQFKLFQRSLQSKVETESTDGLLMLIEKNYDDLVIEGDKLVALRSSEKSQRSNLSCALVVVRLIISCLKLEPKISNMITSVLTSPAEDWTELSWEESMAPGIDMLHHYGPLSRSKSGSNLATNTDIGQGQFEYQRFRRHVSTLFERVTRLSAADTKKSNYPDETGSELNKAIEVTEDEHRTPGRSKKLTKQGRLEALEDDDEEDDDVNNGSQTQGPESDWLNSEVHEGSDIMSNMLLNDKSQRDS